MRVKKPEVYFMDLYITLLVVFLLAGLATVIKYFGGEFLISGYNTSSADEQKYMKEKGIGADRHAAALEELPDEFERALAAGEKKLKNLKNVEARVAAQKLYQHLALRGFGGSIIQKVVRQLTTGVEIED